MLDKLNRSSLRVSPFRISVWTISYDEEMQLTFWVMHHLEAWVLLDTGASHDWVILFIANLAIGGFSFSIDIRR